MFNVVLVHPQIPQNTGNIARLTAANCCALHLVGPMAFEITDTKVKRAGLDYWPEVILFQHSDWASFLANVNPPRDHTWFLTTKAERLYTSVEFSRGDFLIFGSETSGLPAEIHSAYPDRRVTVPMSNKRVRSLNLANAVSAVLYEAIRQCPEEME